VTGLSALDPRPSARAAPVCIAPALPLEAHSAATATAAATMVRPPVIAVFGATGMQGGGVVEALLRSGNWSHRIRALTRDPENLKARALKERGVEVVQCDMTDRGSIKKALTDVSTVFCVTDFYDSSTRNSGGQLGEATVGNNVAEVAKEVGVQHFILSSLCDMNQATGGKYFVAHFTGKHRVTERVRELNFPFHTVVMPGLYWQNFGSLFIKLRRAEDGAIELALPVKGSTQVPGIDIRDLGPVVEKIARDPAAFNRKDIPVAAEYISLEEIVQTLGESLGIPGWYCQLSDEDFRKVFTKPDSADEWRDMFKAFQEFDYYGTRADLGAAHALNPDLKGWKDYLLSINPEYVFSDLLACHD
jgi:uncharacterized protein YbjT (DUF2867 family)